MPNIAKGSPTKEFFVEMLTRDIELNDAILDLLDNCLDGVVRTCPDKDKMHTNDYYKSYGAEITINSSSFSIHDNCGGIPRNIAENYAFRMGRVPTTCSELPTVGIYGIGMKRAIFKIGREAIVHTKNKSNKYSVIIPKNWLDMSDKWDFKIEDNLSSNTLTEDGTIIEISMLNTSITDLWKTSENIKNFIETLKKAIQESYSLIIQKGFSIKINGDRVTADLDELLVQKQNDTGNNGIRPYIFTNQYDDVNVKLVIGFYAPMASEEDIDDMNESRKSSYNAGITIICNDRVVLYNDKSYLTGWGTNGVPNYHTQFIGIKGYVIFESNNPQALPMTTTKRGIDHSSAIYIAVKDKICEGLKMFTNYTNQWKGRNSQEREYSTKAEKVPYSDLFTPEAKYEYGVTLRHDPRGETYRPNLPKPINDKPFSIIRFSKSLEDIKILIEYFYGDKDAEINASVIGEKCFDAIFKEVNK